MRGHIVCRRRGLRRCVWVCDKAVQTRLWARQGSERVPHDHLPRGPSTYRVRQSPGVGKVSIPPRLHAQQISRFNIVRSRSSHTLVGGRVRLNDTWYMKYAPGYRESKYTAIYLSILALPIQKCHRYAKMCLALRLLTCGVRPLADLSAEWAIRLSRWAHGPAPPQSDPVPGLLPAARCRDRQTGAPLPGAGRAGPVCRCCPSWWAACRSSGCPWCCCFWNTAGTGDVTNTARCRMERLRDCARKQPAPKITYFTLHQ